MRKINLMYAGVAMMLLASCAQPETPQYFPNTTYNANWEADVQTTVDFIEAMTSNDFEVASRLVDSTYTAYGPDAETMGNFDDNVNFFMQVYNSYSDISWDRVVYSTTVTQNEDPNLVGNWVFHWATFSGTMNHNGQRIQVPIHLSFKLYNGKIVFQRSYYDNLAIQNAGLIPASTQME